MITFEQASKYKYIDKFCYKHEPSTQCFHIKVSKKNKSFVRSFFRIFDLIYDDEMEEKYCVIFLFNIFKNDVYRQEWMYQPVPNQKQSSRFSNMSMNGKMNHRFIYYIKKTK